MTIQQLMQDMNISCYRLSKVSGIVMKMKIYDDGEQTEEASLFSNHEISQLLKNINITEIETIGVDDNCCVASSAIDAANKGYKVIFHCKYIGVKLQKNLL